MERVNVTKEGWRVTRKVPVQKRGKAEYKRLRQMQEEARVGKPLVSSKLTPQQVRKAIKDAYKIPEMLAEQQRKALDKACRDAQRKVSEIQARCPHRNWAYTRYDSIIPGGFTRWWRCNDCGMVGTE